MVRKKISLLAADCTIHSLARPRILARLLESRFDLEVVAPVFPGDEDVYVQSSWPGRYIPVPVRRLPDFLKSAGDLIDALTGDAIYACKPKATSLGVALLAKRRRRVPVVVDVDDREIYHCYPYSRHFVKNLVLSARDWADPGAYPYTLAMEQLVRRADHVTSVSSYFRSLFGGTIIPQAIDTSMFDPARYDREMLRDQWGLDRYKVVLFLGRPQPHKGLEEILKAVKQSRHPEVRLVIVGGWTPYVETLVRMDRVIFFGPQPFEKGPIFLSMADVVMVPQRDSPISRGQMPTKVPEAMAMGVPVIVTDVADLAEQVRDGGIVVPPNDIVALTNALDRLLSDDDLAKEMGKTARRRCIDLYSLEAVRPKLEGVFARNIEVEPRQDTSVCELRAV